MDKEVLWILRGGYVPALALPAKRLAGFSVRVLSHPISHGVETTMSLQQHEFTRDSISKLTSVLADEAVESHVGAA